MDRYCSACACSPPGVAGRCAGRCAGRGVGGSTLGARRHCAKSRYAGEHSSPQRRTFAPPFMPLFRVDGVFEGRRFVASSETMREQMKCATPLSPPPDGIERSSTEGSEWMISPMMAPSLVPSVTRHLAGRTALDISVDELEVPAGKLSIRLAVIALRWYRKIRPASVGQRCVWDPSCSRYAELSVRERGVIRGLFATVSRLSRCRPNEGGTDLP
jgi:putative component of membrane protein insertase Oxa1/YidC/SpoIIIJ protein YidD